jgi:hypothetical protein
MADPHSAHGTKTFGPSIITQTQGGWMARAQVQGRTITVEGCQSEAEAQELLRASLEAAARQLGVSLPAKAADRTLGELGRRLEASP